MRTLNGEFGLQEVLVQVRADTRPGETVFISGNLPELGQWKVSNAVMLMKVTTDGNIWKGLITVPVKQNIEYRYLICTVVEHEGKPQNIIRQWESHLKPRVLRPFDYIDGKCDLDLFGYQDDVESLSSGWLTNETIVQLKMFNNPIAIWKRRYKDKQISVHVSTIDITRRNSEFIGMEEDSTLTETTVNNWPIVEVAQMNDTSCQFAPQSQFGIIYDPSEFIIFQVQVVNPETIPSKTTKFCTNCLSCGEDLKCQ